MHAWVDNSLVGLALLVSLGYALLALGPKALRRRWFAWLAGALRHIPAAHHLEPLAARLRAKGAPAPGAGGSCGGCGSCGGVEQSAAAATRRDIKVPIERIGRRQ